MPLGPLRQLFAYQRGKRLLRLEAWSKAVASLGHAAALAPGHAPSLALLARAHARLGQLPEAERAARDALAAAPARAASHADLARILLAREHAEEALAAAQRAVELDPALAGGHECVGRALLALDRPAQAVEALGRALEGGADTGAVAMDEDSTPAARRAVLATAQGRLAARAETAATLEDAAARAPCDPTAQLLWGVEAWKLERWEAAEAALARGAALAPEDPCFDFLRVEPLLRLSRAEEATAAQGRVVERGGALPVLPEARAVTRLEQRRRTPWQAGEWGSRAAHCARALAALMPAPARSDAPSGSLLFVLDEDYGELTTVMMLLMGQEFSEQVVLAMPPRLATQNAGALGGRTRVFADLAQLQRIVDELAPEFVLLCSAHLFAVHGLIDDDDLERLVAGLRQRGCPWATTDPFLGLLKEREVSALLSIDLPAGSPAELRERRRADEALLAGHFARSARLCERAAHLYPAPDSREHPPTDGSKRWSFFNPALILDLPALSPGSASDDERPLWLFVLSRTDLDTQMLFEGPRFVDLVVGRMLDALGAGRRALLVGPDELLDAAAERSPVREGLEFLPFCSFENLAALVLAAECAFYWNAVSHSILLRLLNGAPVVLFDRGHLLRNIQDLGERIARRTYQGVEAPHADHRAPLLAKDVASWTDAARTDAVRRLEGFRAAPSPQELIDRLLTGS
jgi:tetratricopeptide (TPR) repeat protein